MATLKDEAPNATPTTPIVEPHTSNVVPMPVAATSPDTMHPAAEKDIVRFDVHQRIQHFALMVSFLVLTFTGLPLKFHDLAISQWWIGIWNGVENTRALHHLAAWVMGLSCAYHAIYLIPCLVSRKRIFPSTKDVQDVIQDILYYLRLRQSSAQYDRFNYREKFDYWAVFWGICIMGISGLILMYPVFFSRIFPSWSVPVALVAHSDESLLAVGWIFIVHMYFVHFSHLVFPFNKSIFTGKVPLERYRLEHPLEYERLTSLQESTPTTAPPGKE